MDGAADDVVQAYTDRVMSLKASANLTKEERRVAKPGAAKPEPVVEEPKARLVAARILDRDGIETAHISANTEFDVEVDYEIFETANVLPAFRFYSEDGHLIFTAVYAAADAGEWKRAPGLYRSRAHIPANLMNVGMHRISIGLNTPHAGGLMRHHVVEDALTFWLHEARFGEQTARGPYTNVKGAVRPIFQWTHKPLDEKS
jgi:hypothetical protein